MSSIAECKWFNLILYVLIEQLFVEGLRRFDIGNTTAMTASLFLDNSFVTSPVATALLVPEFIHALINVGVLMTACNIFDPSVSRLTTGLAVVSLVQIAVSMVSLSSTRSPFNVVFHTGTWEQVRLFVSFLCLRVAAGAPFHSIIVALFRDGALKVNIQEPTHELKIQKINRDYEEDEHREPVHGMVALNLVTVLVIAPLVIGAVLLTTAFPTAKEV